MRKLFFITPVLLLIACLSSCSTVEDFVQEEEIEKENEPIIPNISNLLMSKCLALSDLDFMEVLGEDEEIEDMEDGGYFEMVINGKSAKCKFGSQTVSCELPFKFNVFYKDGTLVIVVYPVAEAWANCICEHDYSFSIENIPQKDFMLKIYKGKNKTGEYDENKPSYTGKVVLADGGLKIPFNVPFS